MSRASLLARVRWDNVARLTAVVAVAAVVVAWPRLGPPPPAVPEGRPQPVLDRGAAMPRTAPTAPRAQARKASTPAPGRPARPRHRAKRRDRPRGTPVEPRPTSPQAARIPRAEPKVPQPERPAAPQPQPVPATSTPPPSAPAVTAAEFGVE